MKKNPGTEIESFSPKTFADVEELVDRIKSREGVIVDFADTPTGLAQRMLDFLSGAIFALGGRVDRIKKKTYILVPRGVTIRTVRVR